MSKICKNCGEEKSVEAFSRDRAKLDGLRTQCRTCHSTSRRAAYEADPSRVLLAQAERRAERRDEINAVRRARRLSDPQQFKAAEKRKYERHGGAMLARSSARYALNPEPRRAKAREYYRANPARYNAYSAERRALRLCQTLPLNQSQRDEMAALYHLSRRLTRETGILHHVDHIVPLKGRRVRGLHVPWNLQILTAKANLAKSNLFEVE